MDPEFEIERSRDGASWRVRLCLHRIAFNTSMALRPGSMRKDGLRRKRTAG
jgi:hypothetical protein